MSFTSSSSEHPAYSTTSLLKEICKHLCHGIDPAESARIAKRCIETVRMHDVSSDNSLSHCDEFSVCERIKKHLRATASEQDAQRFDMLHRKLLRVSQTALGNRTAILSFFLRLSETHALGGASENGNMRLERDINSRAFDIGPHIPAATITQDRSTNRTRAGADIPYRSPNFKASQVMSSTTRHTSTESMNCSNGFSSRELLTMNVNTDRRRGQRSEPMVEPFTKLTSHSSHRTSGKYDVSELQILQELLFCFQGIEGKILRSDTDNGFKIDPLILDSGHELVHCRAVECWNVELDNGNGPFRDPKLANVSHVQMVRHLADLGYLHDLVSGLSQELGQGGTVARSLASAVRDQITDLYGGVTQLHSELRQSVSLSEDSPLAEEAGGRASLTLRRLLVWLPLLRFQVLSDMCRACVGLRGGAIVSAAFPFSYHGDPQVQAVATTILAAATRPLFTLICHWIVQGELYDPYDEFFVAVNKVCPSHNRWKDKYFLRNELIPAVMTEEQAMMVLNAGKCINFLNEICQNKMPVTGARAKLRQLEANHEGELLQLAEPASPLAIIIESAFMEASRLVLDTLKTQFKLFENFQGLRRYMLLGQGDFYRYLMELLQPELNKSVSEVYTHNLMSILESAIRVTNAQFEDKDILERVSVTLLEPSQGETGWDTFTMIYCTDGPLDTVFQLSEGTYKHMFRFLWELKRVEYLLSTFRIDQSCVLKKLGCRSDFSDLKTLLNHTSLMTAEMVHYINQVQYYILFEVIECAFEKFAKKFAAATTIEEVIHDHELFLEEIRRKTLKDDSDTSKKLSSLMQALNMSILDLLSHGSQFVCDAEVEVARREQRERTVAQRGTDFDEEKSHKRAVQTFSSRTHIANTQITLACQGYKANINRIKPVLLSAGWIR